MYRKVVCENLRSCCACKGGQGGLAIGLTELAHLGSERFEAFLEEELEIATVKDWIIYCTRVQQLCGTGQDISVGGE